MKLTQTQLTLVAVAVAAGVYFLYRQKNLTDQFSAAYNALAGKVASGELVDKNATAANLTAATTGN